MKKKILIGVIIIIAIVVIWKLVSHHERETIQQPYQYSQQGYREPQRKSFIGSVASSFGHAAVRGAGTYAGYQAAKGAHSAISNAWGRHKERKATREDNRYPHDSSVYPSHHSSRSHHSSHSHH